MLITVEYEEWAERLITTQGAHNDGPDWLPIIQAIEEVMLRQMFIQHNVKMAMVKDWFSSALCRAFSPLPVHMVETCIKLLEGALFNTAADLDRSRIPNSKHFGSNEEPEEAEAGESSNGIPTAVILNAQKQIYAAKDSLVKAEEQVEIMTQGLRDIEAEVEHRRQELKEWADFLNTHNSDVGHDWYHEAGIEEED